VLLAALLAVLPGARAAAEADVRVAAAGTAVEVVGALEGEAARRLEAALAAAPGARVVVLESGGGNLAVALEAYRLIRARGLDTAARGVCASACAVAFLAGARRSAAAGTRFGFHRASGAGAAVGVADLVLRGMFRHAGVDEAFTERVLATPHETTWWPERAEVEGAGVLTR
jgi:hypothetical protein